MLDRIPRPLLHVIVLAASCAALLLPSRSASASTTIAGGTYSNQTWTAAGSPYIVTGNVTIGPGGTLTIQPGAEVQLANTTLLTITGTLTAVGTAANPITFKAQSGLGKGLWLGIKLNAQGAGTTLDHVHIESAWKGIESNLPGTLFGMTSSSVSFCDLGIQVGAGVPMLDGLTISGNSFGVEYIGSGGGTLSRSTITGSSILGVDVYYTKANLPIAITNTVIRQNFSGVAASGNSNAVSVHITNSTIHGNSHDGVIGAGDASGPAVFIKNSIITQNTLNGILTTGGLVSTTYSDVWGNGTNYSGTGAGSGCISKDPLYVSAPTNLALQSSSSCVDAGTSAGAPSTDLLGVARPLDGDGLNGAQFDMGAYELMPSSVCGDGTVGVGEACDSGAQNGTYGNCKADCSGPGPSCGDGIVNGPEACDDGNQVNTDGCLTTCVLATCGDGFVKDGVEECDDGNASNTDACLVTCKVAACGDGFVEAGVESCDDGNTVDDDACPSDCKAKVSTCGDGVEDPGEACDDGNASNEDECLTTCKITSCGDGFLHAGVEACDDGNDIAGDGCSPQCMNEHAGAGGGGQGGSTSTTGTDGAGGGSSGGPSDQPGGCGCRTAGGFEGPSPAWLLVAAAVVVARRRRAGG